VEGEKRDIIAQVWAGSEQVHFLIAGRYEDVRKQNPVTEEVEYGSHRISHDLLTNVALSQKPELKEIPLTSFLFDFYPSGEVPMIYAYMLDPKFEGRRNGEAFASALLAL